MAARARQENVSYPPPKLAEKIDSGMAICRARPPVLGENGAAQAWEV